MAQIVNYKHVDSHALKGGGALGSLASLPKPVSFRVVGNPISKIRQIFLKLQSRLCVFLHSPFNKQI